MIHTRDPRAWRMIQREVRYIINEHLLSASDYTRWSRVCKINFDEFYINNDPDASDEETREWYVASVAGAIVLAATQGRLDSLGVPYNKTTRERIERVCVMRVRHFLARLQSDTYDLMEIAPDLVPGGWGRYWNFERRRERAREIGARVWPQIRATWKKK